MNAFNFEIILFFYSKFLFFCSCVNGYQRGESRGILERPIVFVIRNYREAKERRIRFL